MIKLGRKRPGEFEGPGIPEGMPPPDGFDDESLRKKAKFDGPGGEEVPDVPPATLRVLIRNSDAGGIIGKVCIIKRVCDWYSN